MTTVATLEVEIKGDDKHLNDALGRSENNLRGAGSRMSGLAGQIGAGIGQGLGIGIGLGIADITAKITSLGPAVINAGISWESAFAGVEKVVDGTSEQLAVLENQLLGLSVGDSPVAGLENAAIQLAGIAEMAGQLGVAREDIAGFTETIAMLQMTTNLAGEEGAAMLAQFANITNMDMSNIDRLGATIVALGNDGASTEAQIVEFAHRLAGAGDQAGMTEAEILALGSAMASAGLNAEAGGTAMTTVLNSMATAAAKGGKALDTFAKVSNTSAANFAETWKNEPTKALTMFLDGLNDLDQAAQLDVLEQLDLDGIRVSDTLRRLSNNVGLVEDSLATANTAWEENTALMNEAQKRAATTEAQWNMLKNKLSAIATVIGSELLPAVNTAIDALGLMAGVGAELLGIDIDFDVDGEAPDIAAEAERIMGPLPAPIDIVQAVNITIEPGEIPWNVWQTEFSDVMSWETFRNNFAQAATAAGFSNIQASSQGITFEVQADALIDGGTATVGRWQDINAAFYDTSRALGEIEKNSAGVEQVSESVNSLDPQKLTDTAIGIGAVGLAMLPVMGALAPATLTAMAASMGAFALAALPFIAAGALIATVDWGEVATEFEELGSALREGDLPTILHEFADAIGAIPMSSAETIGDIFGIDVESGLDAWDDVADAIPVLFSAMAAKIEIAWIDIQIGARETVNSIIETFNQLDAGILGDLGINLDVESLDNTQLEARRREIEMALAGIPIIPTVEEMSMDVANQVPVVGVRLVPEESIGNMLADFSGEPVELRVQSESLDTVAQHWEALEIMMGVPIQTTIDGVIYEDVNALSAALIAGTYDTVATPLVVTISQASYDGVGFMQAQIDNATRNRDTAIAVHSNAAEVGSVIDAAARDRFALITFRIQELGGQIVNDVQNALPGFAAGGDVAGGVPIVVGEDGPEVWVPPGNGEIIPNHALSDSGSGGYGGGGITIQGDIYVQGVQDPDAFFDRMEQIARNRANPGFVMGRR